MFGSMKSDQSKGSVVSDHQVEVTVENRNSFQKKEDVNFSMFGSVKSGNLEESKVSQHAEQKAP